MEKIADTRAYQIHVKPQKALTQFLIICDTISCILVVHLSIGVFLQLLHTLKKS